MKKGKFLNPGAVPSETAQESGSKKRPLKERCRRDNWGNGEKKKHCQRLPLEHREKKKNGRENRNMSTEAK